MVARDVQNGSWDRLVFIFFPIAWDSTANPDYASHLGGVSRDEAIVEAYRLREADQQAALRSGIELAAEIGQRLAHHIVV